MTVTVGGRNYTFACADGQEEHVTRLAGLVDGKLAGMPGGGPLQDARNLLLAALILADELEDAQKGGGGGDGLADGLETIAGRLEKAADTLEGSTAST